MHTDSWGLVSLWGPNMSKHAYKSYRIIIFLNVKMQNVSYDG